MATSYVGRSSGWDGRRRAREQEWAAEAAEGKVKAAQVLERNSTMVGKFVEIAYRKVAARDDYGDENWAALDEEICRFVRKLAEMGEVITRQAWRFRSAKSKGSALAILSTDPIGGALVDSLRERFKEYHRKRKAGASLDHNAAVGGMTGEDFEQHVADLLRAAGASDVSGTARTGDQGRTFFYTEQEAVRGAS